MDRGSIIRIPIFPLPGAILFPGLQLPLHIFEPRYLEMIDDAMAGARIIGMIQPSLDGGARPDGEPELCQVGCFGRITSLTESGDGRYILNLHGVVRFRTLEELDTRAPYRSFRVKPFLGDLDFGMGVLEVEQPPAFQVPSHARGITTRAAVAAKPGAVLASLAATVAEDGFVDAYRVEGPAVAAEARGFSPAAKPDCRFTAEQGWKDIFTVHSGIGAFA